MKAFIVALIAFTLTMGICIANDIYCHSVCEDITEAVAENTPQSARKALKKFKENEFVFKSSVDAGYVVEARVSLESLISAYELDDKYEINRYIRDITVRTDRIKKSLFI